ncbi:MAG TPA: carboxypeptidase regulatory-like domain-containing protein [Acidobacteriaceae bacterium]|nr:carboxypeptidase regulatory-like domain-containing protein [Acidobacteriaceae bacterium]
MDLLERIFAKRERWFALLSLALCLVLPVGLFAQAAGGLHGVVADPSGAVVPGADVTLTQDGVAAHSQSSQDGSYSFRGMPAGTYAMGVQAQGFAPFAQQGVAIVAGQTKEMNVALSIAVEKQSVTVSGRSNTVSVSPEQNSSAIDIQGSDLDALSDNPSELSTELQALAGNSGGPDGGQIYVDGFSSAQMPPKSAIREIRINANPFSAEFDKLGYNRIEIITKAGTNKFSGMMIAAGNDSAFNTASPFVQQQPNYYLYELFGNLSGPLSKDASYFFNGYRLGLHNQSIVNAINPQDTNSTIRELFSSPEDNWSLSPRVDVELGKNNTLTVRDSFNASANRGGGVGVLNLPQQAVNSGSEENDLQAGDTMVVNDHMINETRFSWTRSRTYQTPLYGTPSVTVQGAFTTGGSSGGVNQDHRDTFELQNYDTYTRGNHTIRFGTRWRAYREASYSEANVNGSYVFQTIQHYLAGTPDQYTATVVHNPLARALMVDGAFFYQDDWKWKPNFTVSYGLRMEGQNRISHHVDWAPRLALAWAPGHPGKNPPKTVVRVGYGWFYTRYISPCCGGSSLAVIDAIHNNGINQQSYSVTNPDFYNPQSAAPLADLTANDESSPVIWSIDPRLRANLYMQSAEEVDQQIAKQVTFSLRYQQQRALYTPNAANLTAPYFDPATYTVTGPQPSVYRYQFQSGATWKQQQIIANTSAHLAKLTLNASYTFTEAKSDTQSFNSFPSDPQDPSLDFGRAVWGNHSRYFVFATYTAPWKISVSPFVWGSSGAPYNIIIGNDLTGNNQYNARPTFGTCGAPDVVSTRYGCLDTNPVGKGEKIIPYGLGTGPASLSFNLELSKSIGLGPKVKTEAAAPAAQGNQSAPSAQSKPGSKPPVARKYNLAFSVEALNLLNYVNLNPPNGVMTSPLFGKSQSADTPAGTPGNRVFFLETTFSF